MSHKFLKLCSLFLTPFFPFCSSDFLSLSLLIISFTSCSCPLTPSTVFSVQLYSLALICLVSACIFFFVVVESFPLLLHCFLCQTSLQPLFWHLYQSLISISLKSVSGVLYCPFVWNILPHFFVFFVFLFFLFSLTLYVSFHAFDEIATSSRQRWNHVEDETYPSTWP